MQHTDMTIQNSRVFEEALLTIANRGGTCFTRNAASQYAKIEVECDQGHKWNTTSKRIKNGGWCPICYNSRRSGMKLAAANKMAEVIQFVENKGGKCLSTVYTGRHDKMMFECEFGHLWETTWASIRDGHWCHVCQNIRWITDNKNGRKRTIVCKYSLEDVQKIADSKGGKCLSDKYQKRMQFECALEHQWEAVVGNIIGRDSWCPICASSLYERICRLFFETIFDQKFPTAYPKWLRNKDGQQLELDGYCEPLLLAFEHNGKQHYESVKFRGKTYAFDRLRENDRIKRKLCKQHGIRLIIIPELMSRTKVKDLKEVIAKRCRKLGVDLPVNIDSLNIDYKLVYTSNKEVEAFATLKTKLLAKGYELLSTEYLGSSFRYDVKCLKCGIIRNALYTSLLSHNCGSCQGIKRRLSIDDAVVLASKKNGKCLSTEYTNNHTKMLWECHLEHQWNASYNQIQSGDWCPECFELTRGQKKKLGLEVYQEAATKKGGKCLSTIVSSCYDKLEWQCAEGHIWLARADLVKNTKQWCPECVRQSKTKK